MVFGVWEGVRFSAPPLQNYDVHCMWVVKFIVRDTQSFRPETISNELSSGVAWLYGQMRDRRVVADDKVELGI